jgi:hypothetical protein
MKEMVREADKGKNNSAPYVYRKRKRNSAQYIIPESHNSPLKQYKRYDKIKETVGEAEEGK